MSKPLTFIGEPITVEFKQAPMLEKVPDCPNAFRWRDQLFQVEAVLEEWRDYTRRGPRNMRPTHLSRAQRVGSWGKGRFCFRVRVQGGRIFELYYDRAPESAGDRKGHWFLLGERAENPD